MDIDTLEIGDTAKVRITACPRSYYWYEGMVGSTHTVKKTVIRDLLLVDESHSGTRYYIRPDDCEIVSD
jgi:hypothetical protein